MSSIFQNSSWIWPEDHRWDIQNCYALFRKIVHLPTIPRQAPLFITADQSYQLYVNGHYIGRGPARGVQARWPYDEWNLAKVLRKGKNVFAVRAHHPGFSNFQYLSQGYAGLLVAAHWGKTRIVSDHTWKARRQTGISRDTVPTSLQLFPQEHIDLRIEPPNWSTLTFDDVNWTEPVASVRWNAMPWYSLEPRNIPQLQEDIVMPVTGLGIQKGSCAKGYERCRDASRLFAIEGLSHHPSSFAASDFSLPACKAGRFHRVLLDFGHTVVGSLGLKISGAYGGEIIDTLHVETIKASTLSAHYKPDQHCRMAFSHRLICRTGENEHIFYHTFGFRYLLITVRGPSADLRIQPFLRTAMYPLEIKGRFHSSEPDLNAIWKTCAWTQQVCSMDAYVDTPWREQAQWWGDARVQAWNTFHLSGDPRLFRRGIAQIADQTTPNGLTYGHAPTMAHNCILPDFSVIWIITIWDYYWQTGSTEPLDTHEETIWKILDFFENSRNPLTGLAQHDPRYWLFLDWTDIQREGCPSVLNLWLLIALEKLADLYATRGKKTARTEARRRALRLRKALAPLVNPQGLVHDGFDTRGKRSPKTSVHTQTLAIMAGLKGISPSRMIDKILLPWIREERKFDAQPSAYWCTYVFSVLQDRGYAHEVVAFIRKHWAKMAAHGTTWENFNPDLANESFSHAWSAHPLYHFLQIVGGIRQSAESWKEIVFQPHFIGQESEVILPTPFGPIQSNWKQNGSSVKVSLSLPDGISATVNFPGLKKQRVKRHCSWNVTIDA